MDLNTGMSLNRFLVVNQEGFQLESESKFSWNKEGKKHLVYKSINRFKKNNQISMTVVVNSTQDKHLLAEIAKLPNFSLESIKKSVI